MHCTTKIAMPRRIPVVAQLTNVNASLLPDSLPPDYPGLPNPYLTPT